MGGFSDSLLLLFALSNLGFLRFFTTPARPGRRPGVQFPFGLRRSRAQRNPLRTHPPRPPTPCTFPRLPEVPLFLSIRSAMSAVRSHLALAALAWVAFAPAALAAINTGDIALIGYQSDDPDSLAFVTLAPINAGEIIRFTDSGWIASGSFRANEGGIQYTFPAATPAGTVVSMAGPFTSAGWSVNNTGLGTAFALATAGDQILAFQGAASTPSFIYALNTGGGGWTDASSSNTTALPPGLTPALTALDLAVPELDNSFYSGPTSGTKSQLLATISNPANWTRSDSPLLFPAWAFSVVGAGGPAISSVTLPASSFALNDIVLVTVTLDATPAPGVPAEIDLSSPAFLFTTLTINNPATSGSIPVTLTLGGTYTANAAAFSGATGAADSAPFTVIAPPTPPVAFAGADRTVTLSSASVAVALTGATVSDVNGLAGVLYEWTPISGPGILAWSARSGPSTDPADPASAIVTIAATGLYTFTLAAIDPDLNTAFDNVTITVVSGPPAGQFDPPANYYDPARPGGVWLTGLPLKSALTSIISNHTIRSYDDARVSLGILDADPALPGNILLIYTGVSVPAPWDAGATWNREHQWPQSLFPTGSPLFSDLHHLRASNPSINSSRGNKPYGLLAGFWDPDHGAPDRGDSSRSIFYSATRYADQLTIVNGVPAANQMGDLASMIDFNYQDPPSAFERRRNHLIFSAIDNPLHFQGNRNPFIDHPEFVWAIWGPTPNNSTLSLNTPALDGSSAATVAFRLLQNAGPQSALLTLSKSGSTPTSFDATPSGPFTFQGVGPRQTFTTGPQARPITISLLDTTAVASLTGSVTIDNTDLTSAATGQGDADADDLISISADILAHANPSFSPSSDLNSSTFAASFPVGSGPHQLDIPLYNFNWSALQALLDIDSLSPLAPPFSLISGPTSAVGASPATLRFSFDSSSLTAGLHAADLTLTTSDEDLPGATASILNLRLEVTLTTPPPACPGDANASGFVDFADITSVLSNWAALYPSGAGPGDANSSGAVDFADITSVLSNWAASCP